MYIENRKVFVILLRPAIGGVVLDEKSRVEIESSKKRSLKRYRKNLSCIKRLEKKIALIDERMTTIKSPSLSGMPRGGVPITIDDLISDKQDLENRVKRLKQKSRDLKNAVCEEIDSLEDPLQCEVLEAYFIDCQSIEDIAEDLGYTERYIYSIYSEAIRILSVTFQ